MKDAGISNKLCKWRKAKRLTQSQAAEELGVPVRTLQEWEQSRREPRGLARTMLLTLIGQ